jgi:hypothetical protein
MRIEHEIPEPYLTHIKGLQGAVKQLQAKRDAALATVYRLDRELESLDAHVVALLELQIAEHKLPKAPAGYQLDGNGRMVAEIPDAPPPVKVNGYDGLPQLQQ